MTDEKQISRLLKIDDLRRATAMLLDAAAVRFGEEVDLDEQRLPIAMYWTIRADAAYEVTANPEQGLTVADVGDDLLETAELLKRQDREVVLWHEPRSSPWPAWCPGVSRPSRRDDR